jgi:hypothetical protein
MQFGSVSAAAAAGLIQAICSAFPAVADAAAVAK